MKQGFLILNQGWGKEPTFCRGNDYKWSLQLRDRLLQQLPFWLAWFSPFFTEYCCKKHLILPSDSSVFCCSPHKIKFSCSWFWSFVWPRHHQAAVSVFVLSFSSWRLVHWCSVSLEGFPHFMPDDNNKWILLLGPFIVSFWGQKI